MPKFSFESLRLILLPSLLVGILGFILSNNVNPSVQAFSSGPPAGFTGAPGEFTCAECHVPPDPGTGLISITAPQTYVPGQTYPVTITHTNSDQTRLRWGFQLTALDPSDEKAGNFQSTDVFTQVLDNQGPDGSRQYIEHTGAGTFIGQRNGASWTFSWTAPSTDVGPVTFYAAGNHANNDGNSSGDHVYFTFVASAPASTTADFGLSAVPSKRSLTPGSNTAYSVTVTPLAGFQGTVNFSASGLPAGVSASFNPGAITITDATAKSSTLTIATSPSTPLGNHTIDIISQSGATMHTAQVMLNVVSASSVDLTLSKTASPNPAQLGVNISYRLTATNNGPATATNVNVSDTLPASVSFVSASTSQGTCNGTGSVNCTLGNVAANSTAIITIVVTPSLAGSITNTATISANETDFDISNNSASVTTLVQPAAASPVMLDSNLVVSTVFSGLNQPTSIAFLGSNDLLVLEKTTGKVQRIVNGALHSTVLDLAVNGASERGLLGIALHPDFPTRGFAYLFWTESSTAADTNNTDEITLLGNRVDRYVWNGSTLTFDRNLIRLRALQQDSGQPTRGNHDGGVLRFGPDGKLYILFGDNGRRGFLQNITSGGPVPDDQFGGPEPDNAHMTGVILRLNDDGTTPNDNPFFNASTGLTGEAAANVKKIFAYGVRNGFGMAFDPLSGFLWTQENGDDAFDEMNRVSAGFNGGWIQTMGPLGRVSEFKSIESSYAGGNLQQLRWPPSNIANTPQQALARLFMLPGAQYTDPEFSWKYAVAPSTLGFVEGRGLGRQFESDMLVGASRTTLLNGYLFRFKLSGNRQHFSFSDSRLADLVADNADKFDLAESDSLIVGRDFGITTDIQTGPDGGVFVVSLSNGSIYEIKSKPSQVFVATLNGMQEVPPTNSAASGEASLLLSPDETSGTVTLSFRGLSTQQTDAHIHGPATPGTNGPVVFPLPLGQVSDFQISLTPAQVQDLKSGSLYVNVHSSTFPNGEIRGQLQSSAEASSVQFNATNYAVNESEGSAVIEVTRIGSSRNAVTVNYVTSDGTASNRTDYVTSSGTLYFAAGESRKEFTVPIVDDLFVEGDESVSLTLSGAAGGAFPGSPTTAFLTILSNDVASPTSNPLDEAQFFVNQHYLDFLSREPDPGGLAYWTNEITRCGNNTACMIERRIGVSAAFFIEAEFQQSGSFVYRIYKGALGRQPVYSEFGLDRSKVVNGVEADKTSLLAAFVQRPEFKSIYPETMTNAQFVNKLFDTAGLAPFTAERQHQIDAMNGGKSRALVVRDVVEIQSFQRSRIQPIFCTHAVLWLLEARSRSRWLRLLVGRAEQSRSK